MIITIGRWERCANGKEENSLDFCTVRQRKNCRMEDTNWLAWSEVTILLTLIIEDIIEGQGGSLLRIMA